VVIPNWYTGEIGKSTVIVSEEFRALRENWSLIVLYSGNMGEAQDLDTVVNSIIQMNTNHKFKNVTFCIYGPW